VTAISRADPAWRDEVRRLRFSNREWETRFRREFLEEAVVRSRVMLVVAIFATVGMGLVDVRANVAMQPDFVWASMWQRVCVMAPAWLVMWILPSLPAYERIATWVYPVGTTVVIWSVSLISWGFLQYNPQAQVAAQVNVNVLGIGLISAFALPLTLRGVAFMLVAGYGGILVWFELTVGDRVGSQTLAMTGALIGFAVLIVAVTWIREAGLRRDFAQREEVAALNRELGRLNAEKNEFMAAAAHDLRAPLAAVRGLASQLRGGRLKNTGRETQALSAIDELSGRMLEVVNNYLGEYALEAGKLPVRLERLELRSVIREAAERYGPTAHAKGQRIVPANGPAVFAQGDGSLLGQVLDNFLSNALKFSPEEATVRLVLEEARDADWVRIAVIDRGPGISEADRGKLFRKYGGSGARVTGGESSLGIGLAVAKRVAEAIGGQVGCDSAPGHGATFWVALPKS
jgi:signal transduction histidine kinase